MTRVPVERVLLDTTTTRRDINSARYYMAFGNCEGWITHDDVPLSRVGEEIGRKNGERSERFFRGMLGRMFDGTKTFLAVSQKKSACGPKIEGKMIDYPLDFLKLVSDFQALRIFDTNGHFYVHGWKPGSQTGDADIRMEIREVKPEGLNCWADHSCRLTRSVCEKLFRSNVYTRLPHFCHRLYGDPVRQYKIARPEYPEGPIPEEWETITFWM